MKLKKVLKGEDTYGNEYENIEEMWKKELHPEDCSDYDDEEEEKVEGERIGNEEQWYKK